MIAINKISSVCFTFTTLHSVIDRHTDRQTVGQTVSVSIADHTACSTIG